jgi:hypothetical protein
VRIYVASSWRNAIQPIVVAALRRDGHEVYDFRNPFHGDTGFHWSQIDPGWQQWTAEQFENALGYTLDRLEDSVFSLDHRIAVLEKGQSELLKAAEHARDEMLTKMRDAIRERDERRAAARGLSRSA